MLELTIALIVFFIPLSISPGPGNMFFAANGARYGTRATLPAFTGYHVACWVIVAFAGWGLAGLIERFPTAFAITQYIGAAYVAYLGWTLLRAGTSSAVGEAQPASFLDGAVLMTFNPKAHVIIVLLLTQFMATPNMSPAVLAIWISTVITLTNMVCFMFWIGLGDQIAARFRDEKHARLLNRVFGTVLILVAFWMVLR